MKKFKNLTWNQITTGKFLAELSRLKKLNEMSTILSDPKYPA